MTAQVKTPAAPPSPEASNHPAFARAALGEIEVIDLINAAEELARAGAGAAAIALYRLWLEKAASPFSYAICFNLGVLLSDAGDSDGAERAYRAAIAQNPNFVEARLNLGTLLERLGRQTEAVAAWSEILTQVQPPIAGNQALHLQTLNNLGRLLEIMKQYRSAEDMLALSLKIDPDQPKVISHWVHLRQKQCEWPVFSGLDHIPVDAMMRGTSALAMLSASADPAEQLAAARRFVQEKVATDVAPLTGEHGYGHRRLRIGYLSSDFVSHAVSILTAELYSLHDRDKFEIYGFCWSREDGSPLRARVIAGMDHHVRIGAMSDEEAAHCIREREIDILIDLHGLTLGARPNILSYRPAPVQLTYLGFPGTTGLPAIDYVLADEFVLPPETAAFFTEQPLYLPDTFQINDRQRAIGARPARAACGLPEDAFVFCSFNNNFKFTPEVFGLWMRILRRTPGSVLWLVADSDDIKENLWREGERAGIARARLIFAGRALPADYLARFQLADLFLDTFPFGAGTTASDALWAGLPLLTCAGAVFASRMAGSLLRAVELPELITYNFADYEDKAVELAGQPERIAAMKRQLEDNRMSCALFDSPRLVRNLEAIFTRIARPPAPQAQAEAGSDPVHLYHIAYSEQTLRQVPPGYQALDNRDSAHNDWREYWPMRNFLLNETLDENAYYGFFSPRFQEKTGLNHAQVCAFVAAAGAQTDVISFSPQPDMGAFFLNVFEQEELFQPGFCDASEAFLAAIGLPLRTADLVMDSRQIIFSNYFVARPRFWRDWLTINEKLFELCEGEDNPLRQPLVWETSYPGAVQRKVFLMERIASLLLTINPRWRVKAYNTFDCAWSGSRLKQFKLEAVLSDALKIAMKEQGFHDYFDAFAALREKLR
jgi:predicted O-linked N-acetylglucosamine transferase (SPINDLY family)